MDWDITVLGTASSTQDVLKQRAAQGAAEGTVIQSLQQTAGRGRHGNEWVSPMGNLYMSALLRPDCTADEAGQMAFAVALAVSAAMDSYIDASAHDKQLKWPNDVLVDGLKISGILLETNLKDGRVEWLAVGAGVNIFAPPEERIGLDSIKTKPVFVNVFRDECLAHLKTYYHLWREKGFAPIRDEWLKQAYGIGTDITVRLPEVRLQGRFDGIDDTGALLLTQGGYTNTIRSGDVHFARD